ncbi:MAG: hypothetical protein HRT68_04400 [Flavobacteriaceae bacterium]|nr:hypothetical protein [Flavobacteriaceae bacterium]
MIYAFINLDKKYLKQKRDILEKTFELDINIDVWIEGDYNLLKMIIEENYLSDSDTIVFASIKSIETDTMLSKIKTLRYFSENKISVVSCDNRFRTTLFENLDYYNSFSNQANKIQGYQSKKIVSIKELLEKNVPVNTICKIFGLNRREVKAICEN